MRLGSAPGAWDRSTARSSFWASALRGRVRRAAASSAVPRRWLPCPRAARRPPGPVACACRHRRASTGRGEPSPDDHRGSGRSRRAAAASPTGRCAAAARGDRVEPLQRQRQVRAALGARHRVDLVDDDPLARSAASRAPRDVSNRYSDSGVVIRMSGGVRGDVAPLGGGRVAGAHGDVAHRACGCPRRWAARRDADQRRAQVALDVVRQRLQRRDVQHAQPAHRVSGDGSLTSRSRHHRNAASVLPEPVGARISVCSPSGNRRPALGLGRCGGVKRGTEPGGRRRPESGQRVGRALRAGGSTGHGTASIEASVRPHQSAADRT